MFSNTSINAKVPNVKSVITWDVQTEPLLMNLPSSEQLRVFMSSTMETFSNSRQHQTLSGLLRPPQCGPGEKIDGGNQCGPMVPSKLWRDDNYSQPHISHAKSCTHKHTHFHTLFACPCWLKMQSLIIPVDHQPPKLTHCGDPYCAEEHRTLTLPIQHTDTCACLLIQVLSKQHTLTSA